MNIGQSKKVKRAHRLLLLFIAVIMAGMVAGCEGEEDTPRINPDTLIVPAEYTGGEDAFNQYCAKCHGKAGVGTKEGPPLVHKIYEPNHHGDISFHFAAQRGVRAHHWKFGDMPKVKDITEGEVNDIIDYVRWLQREADIY
jgi:cytochrome c